LIITLKEALNLPQEEIKELKKDIIKSVENKKELGAYIEQLKNIEISEKGSGVPILIKDNINVINWEITACSNILQNYISPYNATVIDNLEKNGLTPFGRANMDEFAMGSSTETSFYGKTKNPFNLNCVPGGSSGGSASAVGGGIAIAALGTDTGGSIRQPAAFCGCVGMKPTYGRVSRYGVIAFSSSLDQVGPLTQNVEDSALLYDIISGYDKKDSTSANIDYISVAKNLNPDKKLKIAVIENYLSEASEEIQKATKEVIKSLEKDGHEIIYKNMLNNEISVSTYYIVAPAEASANLERYDGVRFGNRDLNAKTLKEMYLNTRTNGFGDEVKRRILLGSFVLSSGYYDAYYIKAQKVRHLIKNEYDKIFNDVDLILTPVTPTTAFEIGSSKTPLEMYLEDIFTISVNLAGLPAISIPIGKDKNNMPIGVQLIGKAFDEQTLFDGAMSLERGLK
jgi:aspartyl-tRNA(Asn)/glutamyl-tRNA(Gln) amidotransferase subunit A